MTEMTATLYKRPNGRIVLVDENGKIKKPDGFQLVDLKRFL